MGCGCRKSQYPKKRNTEAHNNISSKSIKNIKDKIKIAANTSSSDIEKRIFICSQCNHKMIFQDKEICSNSNIPIEDISKDRQFSCPLNKFDKY